MSYPGTYVNTPTLGATGLVTGDPDTAVTFDPAGDEYAVSDDTFPQQTLTAFTIGGIIKPAAFANSVNWWGIDGNGVELDLRFDQVAPGRVGVAFAPGGGFFGSAAFYGDTVMSAGSTYRVIATWDGSVVRLYVNGALDGGVLTGGGAVPYSGNGGTAPFSSAEILAGGGTGAWVIDEDLNFYAATDQFDTTGNVSLNGTLDEVFFKANHAATSAEVTAIDDAMTGTGDVETEINAIFPDVYWRLGEPSGTVVADSSVAEPRTEGPTVRLVTARALVVPHQVQRWQLPIICKDVVTTGQGDDIEQPQSVAAIREYFVGLRRTGTPVTYQEGSETHLVVVRDVSFPETQVERWGAGRDGLQGILMVTIDAVEA